ncbi:MAG: signal recognition particle subunit SRP19/SEC65 family protein [Nitrososphaerota archaeon]|nr:signal recognition particle protein Srp19 [Candidatus Bathyarchaeota archaeon]MDW8048985.1 signal recognition particle subunit SRP19/SEC65 family protein [Nitrososphaerota archaeon]
MRRRDAVIIWPSYFDANLTRSEGRRIPRGLSINSPTLSMLEKAVRNLDYKYTLVADAAHPRLPWKRTGFILVNGARRKSQILREIAKNLSKEAHI